ncbi:hypothetical protein JOC37_000230 [Desulfohalotomaculum tongense]|uniref:hypothetical protein n=1 Tax=Desulforadius tongensis TaxID=1216062 RepID=UPI001958B8E5|nr:hypothetical protein [Desulforadius tongensis]MBM7853865.1 hypothetical protein [Desulforadius tongensis]
MQKIIIPILTAALILGGCSAANTAGDNGPNTKTSQNITANQQQNVPLPPEKAEEIMSEYKKLLQNNKPYQVIRFIDENIARLPQVNAGEMIRQLEEMQIQYQEQYTYALFQGNGENQQKLNQLFHYRFDKDKINAIENKDLKSLVTEIVNGGYKFASFEGELYPIIDYEYFKKYIPYLPEDMIAYIEVMSLESNKPMANDAGLVISWDQLAYRTLKADRFLLKYPESARQKQMADLYMMYLGAYMHGLDNTPIFDWETKKLSSEVLNSYQKTISQHKETGTAQIISEYLQLIEKNNFKIDHKILDQGYQLYKKAAQELNLDGFN